MGLLVFRLIWGFIGPKHARFSSFLKGPSAVFRYARGLAMHSVGHNPLGGLMVILMLMLVAVEVSTGLFTTDDIAWAGPYNGAVSGSLAARLTSLHHLNSNFIVGAVVLHLAAIAYYVIVKRENLVQPMLTGWKPAAAVRADEAIGGSELWKAAIVIAASVGVVLWVLWAAPSASSNNW
jgi:cytochrome b